MANTAWHQRIRRAEKLAAQHPYAAEILAFYVHLARFQGRFHQQLERSSTRKDLASNLDPDLPELLAGFPSFLAVVEDKAPGSLTQVAQNLRHSNHNSLSDLFRHSWTMLDSPTDPQEFLALAFLQPYAELLRTRARLQPEGYTHSLCPLCSRKPGLGVLRQQGDGARRSLLCGFCLTEWEFRRVICPGCGEEDHARLPVYTAEELPHIRVECCDTCHTYIKSIDLTKNGLANPLVDELASVPLSLWAQEHGYAKLHPNLLGM